MFLSLVALGGFYLLLSTQLTVDLTLKGSGGYIVMQKVPFVALKQLKTTPWIVNALLFLIDFDQTRHPFWTQLSKWQMFIQNGEYLLISSTPLQSHATSIYNRPKRVCGRYFYLFIFFFLVFWVNCQIWVTWAFSIVCVCTTFEVITPHLNRCFRQRRVQITLIKTLLYFNRIFPIRKQCFINTQNSYFSIVLNSCKSSFTLITVTCILIIRFDSNFDTCHLKLSNL